MTTMDRVIDWAERLAFGVDANFMTGKVTITTPRQKKTFNSADEAIRWARDLSQSAGFSAP